MAWRAKATPVKKRISLGAARASPGGGDVSKGNNNNRTPKASPAAAAGAGTPTVQVIAEIEKKRENRRLAMAAAKKERNEENALNERNGRPGDVDFQRMIKLYRQDKAAKLTQPHTSERATKINICVRKRPVNKKEVKKKDYDSVSCFNPLAVVHECKLKVDGITKYLDSNEFIFDHSFGEDSTNEQVYTNCVQSLVEFVFTQKGRATVFAYGQTGSGKTHTMEGIQHLACQDIFRQLAICPAKLDICVSFFEIYGGRCQDLLHKRRRLTIREDGHKLVQIAGLEECVVHSVSELKAMIEKGNKIRTTHATEVNDQSSRSHAICQIGLRSTKTHALHGKLSLIDLAGSERGADTKSHNRQRRMESSEINKSLLALKECIRALDSNISHVPFRASKLTQVLKDSFVNANARTVMIATVSPCASSTDHTVNTLRYADRVKEKKMDDILVKAAANVVMPVLPPTPPPAMTKVNVHHSTPPPPAMMMPPPPPAQVLPTSASPPAVAAEEGEEEAIGLRDSVSSQDDIRLLHSSLRKQSTNLEDQMTAEDDLVWEQLHETVQTLYEEEENLLSAHMNSIQDNAELLTEEGILLASIQGDEVVDYDIDAYTSRLDEILEKKVGIIQSLRDRLHTFRRRLEDEESVSKQVQRFPVY